VRDDRWSEAIAVGSLAFVETVKNDPGGGFSRAKKSRLSKVSNELPFRRPDA
jgi:hypothetical protein